MKVDKRGFDLEKKVPTRACNLAKQKLARTEANKNTLARTVATTNKLARIMAKARTEADNKRARTTA
eukprot:689547-Ditylum_brightwellii.AAC.2